MKKWNEWKRKLKKDMKAAVTVFVTLMIVPAMLITGTAVDISRIYTARSIMQDANQLALNSTLAQYNALLKDIYGLFAVLENDEYGFSKDEDLKTLIKTYINTAMGYKLEEKNKAPHFQIITPAEEPEFAIKAVYDLSNTAVFRRQIAEYAKIRGPVVLVEKILAGLEALTKIGEDIKTVKSKVKLDKGLKAVIEKTKDLYDSINDANSKIRGVQSHQKYSISKVLKPEFDNLKTLNKEINQQKEELKNMESNNSTATDNTGASQSKADPLAEKKKKLEEKLKQFGKGQEYILFVVIRRYEDIVETVEDTKKRLERVNTNTEKLEKEIDELQKKYNEYKSNLQESSDSTKEALSENKELKELYEKLINNRPRAKTKKFLEHNEGSLDNIIEDVGNALNVFEKQENKSDLGVRFSILKKILNEQKKKKEYKEEDEKWAFIAPNENETEFNKTINGYNEDVVKCDEKLKDSIKKLKEYQNINNENKKYYEFLKKLVDTNELAKGNEAEAAAKKKAEKLNKELKEKQNSIKINPAGAKRRPDDSDGGESSGPLFDRFDEPDKGEDKILDSDELKNMNFSFSKAGNLFLENLILYSYDMTMFSSYNTVLDGDDKEETMNGIPMDKDINYLMHWEKEYLAMGKDSPEANIGMVMGIIAAVRFVLNYISSFGLKNLNRELDILSTPAGQFKVLVKEILRLITVVGETAIDCYKLMPKHTEDGSLVRRQEQDSGSKKKEFDVKDLSSSGQSEPVSLIKMTKDDGKDDWTFSLMGAIDALASNKNETETKSIKPKAVAELDYDGYLNIIMIFALPKLCERTQNLVEYNINNKLQGYEAKDGMELKVKLEEFKTDFSLDTQVKIRTLFMPNINTNGMGLPEPVKNFTIQRKDCRGY